MIESVHEKSKKVNDNSIAIIMKRKEMQCYLKCLYIYWSLTEILNNTYYKSFHHSYNFKLHYEFNKISYST
jgi:hypothetical protein